MRCFHQMIQFVALFLTLFMLGCEPQSRLPIENGVDDGVTAAEAVQRTDHCTKAAPKMTSRTGKVKSQLSAVDEVSAKVNQKAREGAFQEALKTPGFEQVSALKATEYGSYTQGQQYTGKQIFQSVFSGVRVSNAAVAAAELARLDECKSNDDDEVAKVDEDEQEEDAESDSTKDSPKDGLQAKSDPCPKCSMSKTRTFGDKFHPIKKKMLFHAGQDMPGASGSPLLAMDDGVVTSYTGFRNGYGNIVEINHGGGFTTRYAHNTINLVKPGQTVSAGQQIAKLGSTGGSTGPHLHFETRLNGKPINPAPYLGKVR